MHEIIGTRLPNELYYLLSTSLITPSYLSTLIQGVLVESAPLVDSKEYREAVETVRGGCLGIVNLLADVYKNKKYTLSKWFDKPKDLAPISTNMTWPSSTLSQYEKNLNGKKTVDYQIICKWAPKPGQEKGASMLNAEEAKSLILLRSLDVLG
jgi:hypothetical protein